MVTRTRQLAMTGLVVAAFMIGGVSCGEDSGGGGLGEPDDTPTGPGAEAPPPLPSRMAQSQLIVTGTVVHVNGGSATIKVDTVLKGTASNGDLVVVSTDTPPVVGELTVGGGGVWLVSEQGDPPGLLGGGPLGDSEEEVRLELDG